MISIYRICQYPSFANNHENLISVYCNRIYGTAGNFQTTFVLQVNTILNSVGNLVTPPINFNLSFNFLGSQGFFFYAVKSQNKVLPVSYPHRANKYMGLL